MFLFTSNTDCALNLQEVQFNIAMGQHQSATKKQARQQQRLPQYEDVLELITSKSPTPLEAQIFQALQEHTHKEQDPGSHHTCQGTTPVSELSFV